MTQDDDILRAKLNAETGRLAWRELERHFARGVVVRVAGELDLVEVALAMARDDGKAVQAWLADGRIARATAEDAQAWHAAQSEFWAVVAAPWVLVQEVSARLDG
jgi:hypothetical protein